MEHLRKDVRRDREWPAPARMAVAVLAALTFIAIAAAARAEVKPGDLITPANASKVKDLVSPGVYYKVDERDVDEDRPHAEKSTGRLRTRTRPRSIRRRCVSAAIIVAWLATSPGSRSR